MIAKTNLPANHGVVFDHNAATYPGLSSNHHPFTDVAVMSNVDHVV